MANNKKKEVIDTYSDQDVRSPTAALVEAEAKGTAARARQAVGVVSGVGGAISGVAKSLSEPLSAYFEAEANKEIARQRTNQAALKENQPILHELDTPFTTIRFDIGTRRRPIPVSVNVTLLNMFGLGDFAERIYADLLAVKAKNIPNNFSKEWDDVRTPRTQISGSNVTPLGTGTIPATPTETQTQMDRMQEYVLWWQANPWAGLAQQNAKKRELGLV